MDSDQTRARAKTRLLESGVSGQLREFWLEVRRYPSLSTRDDIEQRWNCGVKNVASLERTIETRWGPKDLTFSCGEFVGSTYEIASDSCPVRWPDDKAFSVTTLWFVWNGKQVLVAEYTTGLEASIPSDFSLHSVEELHWSDDWARFLSKTTKAIEDGKRRREEQDRQKRNEQYQTKFS
jgi:hypothetical protein